MGFFSFLPAIGTIIKSVIGGFAISKAISWLAPKPELPDFTQDAEATGVLVNKQSNNANIPVIYGTRLVGGTRVFLETSGNDNQYLYGALVLCEGEINGITKIFVEDKEITFSGSFSDGGTITSNDSRFGDTIQVQTFYGTDAQSQSTLLNNLSSWSNKTRTFAGISYIAFRLTWDADKYIGIPKIQAEVQGRKVVSYTESTTYSEGTNFTYSLDSQTAGFPVLSNTQSKTGTTSAYFGSTNNEIQIPQSQDVVQSALSANNQFTIEFWYYIETATFAPRFINVRKSSSNISDRQITIVEFEGQIRVNNQQGTRISAGSVSDQTWTHIAVTADNGTLKLYIDGVLEGTSTGTTFIDAQSEFNIGGTGPFNTTDTRFHLDGYMDLFRISNNVRYTTNFTPPTTAFTPDANTTLLFNFDGTNGSQDFELLDSSSPVVNVYNAQSPAYSSNPAWCLLDYLTNTTYGKGIDVSDIDLQSFYDSSQIAETQVTPYSGGSDINLFDCNAVIDTSQKLIDNTRTLLKGMRGFLPYAQGKYKLIIETTGSSVLTLNEDNIIGGIKVSSERKNEKYNRVQVNFINPDKNYQSDTIVYDTNHSTLKAEDGGFLQEGIIDLPTITNPYQALEFGEIVLQRSRNNLGLELTANYEAMNLAIGDIVAVSSSITGFSSKPFRVVGMAINPSFEVALSLIEHQDAWYTFDEKTEVAVIPDTSFPDPFTVQPPASITLSDDLVEYNDGTVITRLLITVGDSPDAFVDDFEIEVKQTLDKDGNAVVDDFRLVSQGKALEYQLLNAIDGATYEVRARGINSIGVKSTFVTGTHRVIGATEPPANVEEFSISLIGSDQMQLSWLPVSDLDVESYEIRYQKVSSGYSWFNSTDLVRVPRRSANSIILNKIDPPFTLGIKAIDKLGNESLEPALIVSSNVTAQGYQLLNTISEHPNFAGTFTNTFKRTETGTIAGDNVITLDTISKFDDGIGLIDAVDSNYVFETGGIDKNIISSGFYDFSSTFTLPFVFDATFKIQLDMVADDPYDLFDFGRGEDLFENAKAPFDGNLPTNAGTNIQIGASETSLDDISTFTSVAQQGTFKGKYFKFRARLISLNNQSRALVKGLTVSLNLQKRSETGDDITSGAGTYNVTFTNPFYASPNVNVTGQDMATGDYFVVTNKSTDGFDITFYNSSDVAISRTFDYQANSYGLKSP